jgi:hypothetical protein
VNNPPAAYTENLTGSRSSWLTSRTQDGITRFWLRTPELVGDTFLSILEGYAAPRRTDQHGPDTRPYPQRLGDAFEEWLSRQNPDDLPDHGGLPATLLITTHTGSTTGSTQTPPNTGTQQEDGSSPQGSHRDPEHQHEADTTDNPDTDATADRPEHQAEPDAGTTTGVGTGGTTATGARVSARTIGWLACTANLVPVLLDDAGIPLKLGRTKRLFTPTQRLGFTVRDKGCVFPGCDRPPSWCEAHHIDPWSRGGPTDLTNGCLLCGHHHRLIHQGDWHVIMGTDGRPYVIPPDWIDPARTPLRNSYWHPDWQPKPQP